jgi:hypothetical protein
MVAAVVTFRAEALVRAEPVKGGRPRPPGGLAFKNALSSANIVGTFYLPTQWT